MFDTNFTEVLVTILQYSPIGIISGIITWFASKRYFQKIELKKAETEAEGTVSDVLSRNIGIYQNMLDDLEKRYEERITKLDGEIKEIEGKYETIIANLKQRIAVLEEECIKNNKDVD